jgi:hypothetical protein
MEIALIFIAAVCVYNTWQLSKLNDYNENITTYTIDMVDAAEPKKRGRPRKITVR